MSKSKLFSQVVSTVAEWDEVIEAHCLPKDTKEIAGIPIDARFEDLTSEEIKTLSDWYVERGVTILLRLASEALALHILGAEEVNPAQARYNWVRGKKDEKKYLWLANNAHNRVQTASNLGSIDKEGLVYDVVNDYFAVGPNGHVDAVANVLSLAHRCKAPLLVLDETGDWHTIEIIVHIGMPPQLCAVLDRNAPKTGNDQEFMDRTQFTFEFMQAVLDESMPEDSEKLRNELAKNLVTVRNSLWSRLHGTGYHPSKAQQPSMRQARQLQACFDSSSVIVVDEDGEERRVDFNEDELQELLLRVWDASRTDDGKKALWASYMSVPMVACQIVLASNRDKGQWNPGDSVSIDWDVCKRILSALGSSSEQGSEGYSSYLREVAKVKAQPKKPTGMDRWVYWGFTAATSAMLDGSYNPDEKYFPAVTAKLTKALKDGKTSEPILGGYDCGIVSEEDDD